jgi:hypothetical protein
VIVVISELNWFAIFFNLHTLYSLQIRFASFNWMMTYAIFSMAQSHGSIHWNEISYRRTKNTKAEISQALCVYLIVE